MSAKITLFAALVIISSLMAGGRSKLSREEKTEVKEARKDAARARKKVQRAYICERCRGSGKLVRKQTFGDRSEFKKEVPGKCGDCAGIGIRITGPLHAAMREYYSVIAAHEPKLRFHIENKPTLGRWLIKQMKNPEFAIQFQRYWVDHKSSTTRGAAFLLPVEGVGAYVNSEAGWTLVIAKVLGTSQTVLLLFREWTPPELNRVLSLGAPEKLVVVAYSEGRQAYENWLKEWSASSSDPDRIATIDTAREGKERLARALTEANRLVEYNGHILTVADVARPK